MILQVRSKEMLLEDVNFLITVKLEKQRFWIRRKLLDIENRECIQNINGTGWESAVNVVDNRSYVVANNITANHVLILRRHDQITALQSTSEVFLQLSHNGVILAHFADVEL